MSGGKNQRRHKRCEAINKYVKLVDKKRGSQFLLITDESDSGIGCIYTGKFPPETGTFLCMYQDGTKKTADLKWIKKLTLNIYRLGLEFKDDNN